LNRTFEKNEFWLKFSLIKFSSFSTESVDSRRSAYFFHGISLKVFFRPIARQLQVSEATVINQQGIINRHINPYIGRRKLGKLNPLDVENLYTHLSGYLSRKSIEGVHAVLDKAYADALKKEIVIRNPMKLVERQKVRKQDIIVPDPDAVTQAITIAAPIVGMGMSIIAATGLRRGELLALRWNEINLERKQIRVHRNLQYIKKQIVILPVKSDAGRRTVAMPDSLVDTLRQYRQWQREYLLQQGIRTDLVIHNRQGEPYKPTTYSAAVKDAGNKAGLVNLGPHQLRHLHATHLMEQGIHPRVVQERLGHANITTTLTVYSHVLDHMQDKAAEAADALVSCPSFCPSKG
jgi:integrase